MAFAGAYEFVFSPHLYSAEFSINGKEFKEEISEEKYYSFSPLEVIYIIGKSGEVYIRSVK